MGPDRGPKRIAALAVTSIFVFGLLGARLIWLGWTGSEAHGRLYSSDVISETLARPDVVDRRGRLIATDVEVPSLFADPSLIDDPDDVINKLSDVLGEALIRPLKDDLKDRTRRFLWIRRGLSPRLAQAVHDLGLPGLKFRTERRRVYPNGMLAGHVIGFVNADNRGMAGIERTLDDMGLTHPVLASGDVALKPVALTIDVGAEFVLQDELRAAMSRYGAAGAGGVVMDANTGEVIAIASEPGVDPGEPGAAATADGEHNDHMRLETFELGSVFKAFTVAMAIDLGLVTPDTIIDVQLPLKVGRFTIHDLHPPGRPLSVREVFVHSSNIGAGKIAAMVGTERERAFLDKLGLTKAGSDEAGAEAAPQLPRRWGEAETITIGFGHGLAVAPIRVATAAAAILNGGVRVEPRLMAGNVRGGAEPRVVSERTVRIVRAMMRRNVIDPAGTGKRADVPGLEVGGKTGTAEIAMLGGYAKHRVVASFLAAFPMSAPQYVVYLVLFEPRHTEALAPEVTAGVNAAPTTGRVIRRLQPILGLVPAPVGATVSGPTPAGASAPQ